MENKLHINMESIPKELNFILRILVTGDSSNIYESRRELKDINWQMFLDLATHHRLYPLLYGKLKQIKDDACPPYVEQNLSEAFKRNTFEMLRLTAEMEGIGKQFHDSQIQMLVLKGPVLAKDLYGDLSLRTCGDLDILIPIQDLEKVNDILQNQGYLKIDFIDKTMDDWKWRNHHIKYYHPQKKMNIEIHWRLNPFPGTGPNFGELWVQKRKSTLTSYPIYYLGKEDLFLFLVSHGARHGWFRLRWLIDIHQMMKQDLDWKYLYKQLKKYQYLPAGGQALVLASNLLHTSISSNREMKKLVKGSLPHKLAQDAVFFLDKMIDLHEETVSQDVVDYHKKHLFALLTTRQKCLYILSYLHPFPLDAETLPLPRSLHILYFPLRPFLWVWRKTRKHALP